MWPANTRLKQTDLGGKSRTLGQLLTWDIPSSGFLQGIHLDIQGSLAGTLSALNPLGKASIIRRIKLMANSGLAIIDISGAGMQYLLREQFEVGFDPFPYSDARSAVATGAFNLSCYLPVAINSRDEYGIIGLQNQATKLTLSVEFETDSVIATGNTTTCTVTPYMDYFTVPAKKEDWPVKGLAVAHTITEEQIIVSGAGEVQHNWLRENEYLSLYYGMGIGVSAADSWSRAKLRVQQSDFVFDAPPAYFTGQFARYRGRTRPLGTIPFDFSFSSGVGNYGSPRDYFATNDVSDVTTIVTATGAATLYILKRQLVKVN